MNRILAVAVGLVISMSSFASDPSDMNSLTSLSQELGILKTSLETARAARKGHVIKVVISTSIAALLVGHGLNSISNPGTEMWGLFTHYYGVGILGVAAGVGTYGGYQGVRIAVKTNQINFLIQSIDNKRKEIDAAQNLLEAVGD